MMKRRLFLMSAMSAVGLSRAPLAHAAERRGAIPKPEPLVWPTVGPPRAGIRAFNGHTDTVLDIVGRIGPPPSLVVFTEGNHLMALLGQEIVGALPAWARAQPDRAELGWDNVVAVTLPQPIVVQMVGTGSLSLGNLTIDFTRASGLYPDVVMAGAAPLRELRSLGAVEPRARLFCKTRGPALVVRRGNPLGIHGLADVARAGARIAQADAGEAGARARNRAAIEGLIGKQGADGFFANEVEHFPGRLGIMHRDVPEMVARGYADVGLTHYHLASYWTRSFPALFALVPIPGAERFPVQIGLVRVVDSPRPRAARAFEEFLLDRAREVYPRYDFAHMGDEEYGAVVDLE